MLHNNSGLNEINYFQYDEVNQPYNTYTISFKTLNDLNKKMEGYIYLDSKEDTYITFCRNEKKYYHQLTSTILTAPLNTHWKAHLICDAQDIPLLWNTVIPILLAYKCAVFKCIKLCHWPQDTEIPPNMQFTICIPPHQEKEYHKMLCEIEEKLKDVKIQPMHYETDSLRKIGIYTYVRFSGYQDKYISEKAATIKAKELNQHNNNNNPFYAYNLPGKKDPFNTISFTDSPKLERTQSVGNLKNAVSEEKKSETKQPPKLHRSKSFGKIPLLLFTDKTSEAVKNKIPPYLITQQKKPNP